MAKLQYEIVFVFEEPYQSRVMSSHQTELAARKRVKQNIKDSLYSAQIFTIGDVTHCVTPIGFVLRDKLTKQIIEVFVNSNYKEKYFI